MTSEDNFKPLVWVPAFLVLVLVECVLLYVLISGQAEAHLAGLLIAICTVAIFILLSPRVGAITELTFANFSTKLERIEGKTERHEGEIKELILGSMGKHTYKNLKKFEDGNYGHYVKQHHMGLETELYHLRNLGYITEKENVIIFNIKDKGDQLSDYIEITDQGKKYIKLREKYESEKNDPKE